MSRLGRVVAAAAFAVAGLGAAHVGLSTLEARAEGDAVGAATRGVWTAERSKWRVSGGGTATLVELTLRRSETHGHWSSSESLPLAELRGLGAEQLDAASADVRFDWVRDAGTFACQGRFETGVGAGHFTFAANREYVADMKRRGFGEIDDDKALSLALHDVSRAFVDELGRLGYAKVSLDELVSLRIHGATAEFVRGLQGLGYKGLPVDQLVSLRIHGASLDYVREMQALGFAGLPVDRLVSFRIHGVSPEYVRAFRQLGYEQLTADQLVSMRIHGVSPEFVKRVQGRSGRGVSVDQLVSMRIHGQSED
jgi:hypothetical protein